MEIFINQLEELRARARNSHVQNKHRKLPEAFSARFGPGRVLSSRTSVATASLPQRSNSDIFTALRKSEIFGA